MQNSHQSVEHFRADRFINVIILSEIHLFRINALIENRFSEHFDLFLITHSIFVINWFPLFILINALFLLLSLLNSHQSLAGWRAYSLRHQIIHSFAFQQARHILELDVSFEWHIWHYNADVLCGNQSIIIKIVHVERKFHFLA